MKVFAVLFSTLSSLALASGFVPSDPFMTHRATSLAMSDAIQTGSVKWFDTVKGYGFIIPDDGSNDIFVHQTAINVKGFRSLAENERVEFRTETDDNGRVKALDVTGPDGSDVKGAPYDPNKDFEEW